jgi:serine/threonine protein kinase
MIVTTAIRDSLGRYHVEAELGRGAMGVVYRARDPKIDRLVAIKTISLVGKEEAEEQEYRDRFVQEARAAGQLAHPGIVTVFDAGEDPETHEPFFVMEYVAGRSLSDEISAAGGRLPLPKALQFACEVADALHYAHSHGVIHGDIKPANILVTNDGHAKIADFGVARLNQAVANHAGKIFGSPAYMAPEQLTGGEPDARSDLFSLGVMLYSMLAGFRPFQGNSAQTVCFKVMNVEPVPVSSFQPDLPPELDRIVLRAIAKDARERYQSGAEITADVRAFVSNDDSFAEATRFFTRVLEHDRSAARQARSRATLSRRSVSQLAVAVLAIASLLTGMELAKGYREADSIVAPSASVAAVPHAPAVQKSVPEVRPTQIVQRRRDISPVQTAKVRVEILHQFASGRASVWLDQQLVMDQELRGNTQRHGLFRLVVMNQITSLQFAPGKHSFQVRVISPAIPYDQTGTIEADLTAGPEHVLYVNCDKRKLQIKLQ